MLTSGQKYNNATDGQHDPVSKPALDQKRLLVQAAAWLESMCDRLYIHSYMHKLVAFVATKQSRSQDKLPQCTLYVYG